MLKRIFRVETNPVKRRRNALIGLLSLATFSGLLIGMWAMSVMAYAPDVFRHPDALVLFGVPTLITWLMVALSAAVGYSELWKELMRHDDAHTAP